VGLGREVEKDIWGVEGKIHKRTSVNSAEFRLKK